jgi:predicted small secreted protein
MHCARIGKNGSIRLESRSHHGRRREKTGAGCRLASISAIFCRFAGSFWFQRLTDLDVRHSTFRSSEPRNLGGLFQRVSRNGRFTEVVMKKLTALALALIYSTLLGCNTMHGLGQDIERGGEKIQGEAREHQR